MKTYVKPVLRYENFQLNQSVASCYVVLDEYGNLVKDNTGYTADGSFGASCTNPVENYNYYATTPGNGVTFHS